MAIQASTLGSGLIRNSGTFLGGATDWTYMYWCSPISTKPTGAGYRAYHVLGDDTYAGNYVRERSDAASKNISSSFFDGGAGTGAVKPITVVNDWFHIAIVYDNTAKTIKFYVNRILVETINGADFSAIAFTSEKLMYDATGNWSSLAVQNYRSWTQVLTSDQIIAESGSNLAVFSTNLFCDTPLSSISDLTDHSGNGRNWVATGILTNAEYGPVFISGPPTNLTQETALEIPSLNYCLIQDAISGGAAVSELWYKHTVTDPIYMWGIYPSGNAAYQVIVNILTDAGIVFTQSLNSNVPVQNTADKGTTYYIQIITTAPTVSPAILVIQFTKAPNLGAPPGSIVIPGDGLGDGDISVPFPCVFISTVDSGQIAKGDILRFAPSYAVGEQGDSSPEGYTILGNSYYQTGYIIRGTIATPISSIRADRFNRKWYTGYNQTVNRIDSLGNLESVSWTIPLYQGGTLAANGTVLYYSDPALPGIRAWDLVNNVALPFLVSGYIPGDILLLFDGTILAMDRGTTTTVYHYNSVGTVLNTYVITTVAFSYAGSRMGWGGDSTTTFWAFYHTLNYTNLDEIRVSDGAILNHVILPEFNFNIYSPAMPTTPEARFGNVRSCPFWELMAPVGPEIGAYSGLYKINPQSLKGYDTLWEDATLKTTASHNIPDPFFKTALLGD